MKKVFLFLCIVILSAVQAFSQSDSLSKKANGRFQLGMRSTISAFSDAGYIGMGTGGQFRIQLGSRLNTDWFGDYITTDIGGLAKRTDYHIGWSVLFYPFNNQIKKGKLTPYILAGHCFDFTKVQRNGGATSYAPDASRWSAAVQSGLGAHYNLADNFDLSLTVQYMLHLGKDVNATIFNNETTGQRDIQIQKGDLGLDGHLLINLSLNVYICHLWKKK